MGSIPFISYLKFVKGNKKIFFQDVQIKGFIYLILISVLVMIVYLLSINYDSSILDKVRIASFNVISMSINTKNSKGSKDH